MVMMGMDPWDCGREALSKKKNKRKKNKGKKRKESEGQKEMGWVGDDVVTCQ
jgi:hypothetical protein